MTCNYNRVIDSVSDWEKNLKKKLAAFQSLLMEKHLLNGVSPEERREFESKLESVFTDVIIAFEKPLVIPWKWVYTLNNQGIWFSLDSGIKERADIPHQLVSDEQTKSLHFRSLMEEMQREDILTDYLDKICGCIKNRRFPANKLYDLENLANILNADQIKCNDSILLDMIEMGFKETEQSVFRSIRLVSLIYILNKTSMMERCSSRLKSQLFL